MFRITHRWDVSEVENFFKERGYSVSTRSKEDYEVADITLNKDSARIISDLSDFHSVSKDSGIKFQLEKKLASLTLDQVQPVRSEFDAKSLEEEPLSSELDALSSLEEEPLASEIEVLPPLENESLPLEVESPPYSPRLFAPVLEVSQTRSQTPKPVAQEKSAHELVRSRSF
jgi:hypothetical protein